MGEPSLAVADLVVKLHSNIDSIHQCIQSLSDTSSHDAKLERLSTERETKIAELRQAHEDALKELALQRENEAKELAEQRKKEEEELDAQRQREYEELMARRKREDEERAAKLQAQEEERARLKKEEDDKREQERIDTERSLQEKVEAELERLEDEMEKKVEEGKRALRELDEKRKAINEQIDRALNTPTVIPTITFRSRAKTLRSEQKDVSKASSALVVNEPKDAPTELVVTTDTSRKIETPITNGARDAPVDTRAEYDNSPEESNVAVSDASAESNAIEHKKSTVEADNAEVAVTKDAAKEEETKLVEAPPAVEEPQHDISENEKKTGPEQHGQMPTEDEAVGINAVSMLSDSEPITADIAERASDTQEPHSEVDDHEVKDGHEPYHLIKQDASSRSESQARECSADPGDKPSEEVKDTHTEVEKLSPEDFCTPLKAPSSDSSETHHGFYENTDQEPTNVSEEMMESNSINEPVKFPEEDPATKTYEAEKTFEGGNHVPENQHVTFASDQAETIAIEDNPLHNPDNETLNNLEIGSRGGQDRYGANNSEAAVDQHRANEHDEFIDEQSIKPEQHTNIEEPIRPDDATESAPAQQDPVEVALSGVEEQAAEEPPIPEAEPDQAHEETTGLDEDTSAPVEYVSVKTNRQLEREEFQGKEATEERASVPKDDTNQPTEAEPPVAWWEKGSQSASPAQAPVSESSLVSKSPPQDKEQNHVEHPEAIPQDADSVGGDMPPSENQEYVEAVENSEFEDIIASEAPPTAITEAHLDEPSHLSDIDEEVDGSELASGIAAGLHEPPTEFPEQQEASEFHSPPILSNESRGMGWDEVSRQIRVEEKEVDSASESMEHPDLDKDSAPLEEERKSGINQALKDYPEASTCTDHTTIEPQLKEQELLDTQDVQHIMFNQTNEPGNSQTVEAKTSQEVADQEHDILNDYAPSGPTLHDENDPRQEEPGRPLQYSTHQETQPSEHETLHDRPTTPVQNSSTYDFAPSTPLHLNHEEYQNGLAESPATVLDADDLFEDSEEEEGEQNNIGGSNVDPSQDLTAQSSEHIQEIQGDPEETPDDAPETRAFFASLVDTIRPNISLLKRLANQESSSATHQLDDNHSLSEFSQATPGEYYTPGTIEPAEHFPPQDPDTGLHIRTNIDDTLPSFESYAHSDDASTPTTPSEAASSPFMEDPNGQPTIRSSWQDNSALQGSDPTEEHHELKPQASPLQGEFDPYNTQTYPNYISPKASSVSLRTDDSRNNSFSYSGDVDPPRFSTQSSISPPPVPPKSPRLSLLNLSESSPVSARRSYDSPISATHSQPESESTEQYSPTQSRIPRRPTDRTVVAARTPISSPSIPSNSFFQKTRSLFESASQSPSPPAPTRPLSNLFTVRNSPTSSPSPPRRNPNRPSSLLLSSPGQEEIIPRSLDKDGKPPSPVFTLPASSTPTRGKRLSYEGRQEESGRHRNSNPFLDGLSKLVGSGGLEDSIHNPNRRLSTREKEPLLKHAGEMDGY